MAGAIAGNVAARRPRRRRLQPDGLGGAEAVPPRSQGTAAATAAEAAAAATVTLSSLADDAAVRAVYEGPDGADRRAPGRVRSCST